MVRRFSGGVLAALVASLPLPAQEARARVVETRRAAVERGSLPWFEHGFELVEAQLDVDVLAAERTAKELWEYAEDSTIPGLVATAAATVALVVVVQEGPREAQEWLQRHPDLPGGVAPSLRARFWMARARVLCYQGNHAEEMECAVPGRAAADEADDPVLRVRGMAMTAHIQPERGLHSLQQIFDRAEANGRGGDVEHLRPLLKIERRAQALERGEQQLAEGLDAELAADAERLGNLRLQTLVLANHANRLYQQHHRADAVVVYERVAQLFDRLGDRRQRFGVRNMLAWAAIHRGDLEEAQRRTEANRELIEGRGFASDEKELLRIRFDLAVRQRDADLAAELKRQLERFDAEATAMEQRSDELRARVRAAEAEREAAEERLAALVAAADARANQARTVGGIGLVIGLTTMVGSSWRARRRLLAANRLLAEQIRRVEESQAAQAKLEARMREIERIESLGTMAAGVAHDFNNLLTSVLGSVELIERSPCDAANAELARTAHAAGTQAARLCRQLQAYAGGPPIQLEPMDLVAMAREMVPALVAATRGAVAVSVATSAPRIGVHGDRAQLEQVLLNLVSNAGDAHAHQVHLTIDAEPDPVQAPGEVQITVSDDGDGMTSEVQQRVFDPFFTTRFPGRGLGLAVVHGVVRRHAGRVEVHSEPGAGSTFTIRLPSALAPEPAVMVSRPLPDQAPTGETTIVVIDDDASVRALFAHVLGRAGHDIVVVASGEELPAAVAGIPASRRLVAFIDLTMPGMDGVEVALALRASRPQVAIVLMSGHPAEYVEQVAGSLHPDRVLSKPFLVDELTAILATLPHRGPLVSAASSDRRSSAVS